MVPELRHLVGWVVANDSTINLHLFNAKGILVDFGSEESWSCRGSTSSGSDRNIIILGFFLGKPLAVKSWLLAVVVVSDDEELLRKCILDVVIAKHIFHDIVEILSRIEGIIKNGEYLRQELSEH